ncbi:TadE family protein [Arthrobacter sp. UCD-GKA]|uniref:TadE family protein n=1 Tax=Arthrobacter sp. UCD-GKA TaxID=1913576 RepID=UPI0009F1A799|nr:TadE family protein [Arthrobacter sp. UCD-GKA]
MATERQRGASAVEFALILPVLLTLVLGIVEFGNFFNQQLSVTQIARESARQYAIHHSDSGGYDVGANTQTTATLMGLGTLDDVSATSCSTGTTTLVTITMKYVPLTGWPMFLSPDEIVGQGAMRCGG